VPHLINAIAGLRPSVAAILRLRPAGPTQFQATLGGSAFCVVADRYLVTAFHVLNGGQPRDANDRFVAFVVPGNGEAAFHFPVTGFPVERPDVDIAVLEIGRAAAPGVTIPAVALSFDRSPDGARVITVGFPSPEIAGLTVDPAGTFLGGQFFLKSHANEGIVSAQYDIAGSLVYELNIGWHNGESGGPIATMSDPPRAFSLMQHYRNVQTPHGTAAGPHRGCALSAIRQDLARLGVPGA
jgi:hypothetical protein